MKTIHLRLEHKIVFWFEYFSRLQLYSILSSCFVVRDKFHLGESLERGFCRLAWEKPPSVSRDMASHFNKDQCLDMSTSQDYCSFYNLPSMNEHNTAILYQLLLLSLLGSAFITILFLCFQNRKRIAMSPMLKIWSASNHWEDGRNKLLKCSMTITINQGKKTQPPES